MTKDETQAYRQKGVELLATLKQQEDNLLHKKAKLEKELAESDYRLRQMEKRMRNILVAFIGLGVFVFLKYLGE